jgi:hypothetical protein
MTALQRTPVTRSLLLATVLVACRLGGPDAPAPTTNVDADAGTPPITVVDAATVMPEAGPEVAAVDSASCGAPFAANVCEPVCNSGCPALLRCDVSDVPHAGTCVGIWITQEGDACWKGNGTDACAVGLTCLEDKCARLCYRDSDCTRPGTCCARELDGPAGKTGFRVCAPCAM